MALPMRSSCCPSCKEGRSCSQLSSNPDTFSEENNAASISNIRSLPNSTSLKHTAWTPGAPEMSEMQAQWHAGSSQFPPHFTRHHTHDLCTLQSINIGSISSNNTPKQTGRDGCMTAPSEPKAQTATKGQLNNRSWHHHMPTLLPCLTHRQAWWGEPCRTISLVKGSLMRGPTCYSSAQLASCWWRLAPIHDGHTPRVAHRMLIHAISFRNEGATPHDRPVKE